MYVLFDFLFIRTVFINFKFIFITFQRPHKANQDEMTKYHSDDYIRFLKNIRPDNMNENNKLMLKCKYICCL